MGRASLLVVSNGHGEDTIAAAIVAGLLEETDSIGVSAFPLVGDGGAYSSRGIGTVGPTRKLPTGGFARQSIGHLLKDARAGLFGLLREQVAFIKGNASDFDYCLCVGDIFPLWLSAAIGKLPCFFVSTAKSDYYTPGKYHHSRPEARLIAKWARAAYARDAITAESLSRMGVACKYLGNVMMDCIGATGTPLGIPGNASMVGILPGSRDEAVMNMQDISVVIGHLSSITAVELAFPVALAPSIDAGAVVGGLTPMGWVGFEHGNPSDGLIMAMRNPKAPNCSLYLYRNRFGDIIEQSMVVLGLSGTGNEQAAGLGKPLVTFTGRGDQFTESFAKAQTFLLGEAVSFNGSSLQDAAGDIADLLTDGERRNRMGRAGRERMGETGAARRIAADILAGMGRMGHA